jgi:CBS domain-containing protein
LAINIPPPLKEIAEDLRAGNVPQRPTVRTFLKWFGAQRRGYYVVKDIRAVLRKLQLATDPDFESAWIDEPIAIIDRKGTPTPTISTIVAEGEASPSAPATGGIPNVANDPAYRIGKLDAANRTPISVQKTAPLMEAVTLMLAHDYSQLPVMQGKRDVKGMVSWRAIGKTLHFAIPVNSVGDCMEAHYEISSDASLFAAIPTIVQHEYVLVRDHEKRITGIVTTADLSLQFRTLAEPFLLLGEAENHIRAMLDRCFSPQVLASAKTPGDTGRAIHSASDLNFGEYKRVLEDPENWSKLHLNLDRASFVVLLDKVRQIRNDVMHFDPDGIADADVQTLRHFSTFVRDLAQAGLI